MATDWPRRPRRAEPVPVLMGYPQTQAAFVAAPAPRAVVALQIPPARIRNVGGIMYYSARVPPGVVAGQVLGVTVPDGRQLTFMLPPRALPGMDLELWYDQQAGTLVALD